MYTNHTAIISINYTTPPFMHNTILIWHDHWPVWCDFDRASSLICGNEMPTRCNRRFYCRSYCLLNMFWGTTIPIIRSSRVSYSGCCLWYFVLWFSSWSGVELRVMCPVCRMLQHLHTISNVTFSAFHTCSLILCFPFTTECTVDQVQSTVVSYYCGQCPVTWTPSTQQSHHTILKFLLV